MNYFETSSILRTAEWVLHGHPDKLADAIADGIVQAAWKKDPRALVAVEVVVPTLNLGPFEVRVLWDTGASQTIGGIWLGCLTTGAITISGASSDSRTWNRWACER